VGWPASARVGQRSNDPTLRQAPPVAGGVRRRDACAQHPGGPIPGPRRRQKPLPRERKARETGRPRLDLEIGRGEHLAMRPEDIQQIGDELAIKWSDGSESFIRLERMRRACPCAGCKGEVDVMGRLHKGPDQPLNPSAFRLGRVVPVGTYALQPIWLDGHASGICETR
jgi:DUF971 family protein